MKTTKEYCIARLNTIIANSATRYKLFVSTSEWKKYDYDRTYFSIIEKGIRHYTKRDFGYFDNLLSEYIPGKADLTENYTFSGALF